MLSNGLANIFFVKRAIAEKNIFGNSIGAKLIDSSVTNEQSEKSDFGNYGTPENNRVPDWGIFSY